MLSNNSMTFISGNMIFKLLAVFLVVKAGSSYRYNKHKGKLRNKDSTWNLNETFFPPLLNEVTRDPAPTEVTPQAYPWLARVTPTPHLDHPSLCTAACIGERLFVTAARCAIGLTVGYASIVYKEIILPVLTIVIPNIENKSKQYFDDIGILITKPSKIKNPAEWATVEIMDVNRTDSEFEWFEKLGYEDAPMQHKLVAYFDDNKELKRKVLELPVSVGIKFCQKIYSRDHELDGYFVPCALACTYEQFLNYDQHENCKKQIAIEGAVVYNTKTQKLLGISTWVGKEVKQGQATKLPIGIAVVNSRNFWKDMECALMIRDYVGDVHEGFFQELCDGPS